METTLPIEIRKSNAVRRQLERNGPYAVYRIWHFEKDGLERPVSFEVITIKFQNAREIKGNFIAAHEEYPGDEKFGRIAWCYPTADLAYAKFNQLTMEAQNG